MKTTGDGTFDSSENDAKGAAGLKCDSTFAMTGGLLLVESSGSGSKGVKTDMEMTVSGGNLKVITTGKEYTYNRYSASPKGLKADGNMSVTGGTIQVRCSNAEGIETKGTLTINDGTIESYSGDNAINSKLNMTLNGGYIYAHYTGNDGIDSNKNHVELEQNIHLPIGELYKENFFNLIELNYLK